MVVVSTTTSGCTMISCEEYCVGSSVIVESEMSEFLLGYTLRPLEDWLEEEWCDDDDRWW